MAWLRQLLTWLTKPFSGKQTESEPTPEVMICIYTSPDGSARFIPGMISELLVPDRICKVLVLATRDAQDNPTKLFLVFGPPAGEFESSVNYLHRELACAFDGQHCFSSGSPKVIGGCDCMTQDIGGRVGLRFYGKSHDYGPCFCSHCDPKLDLVQDVLGMPVIYE